MTPIRVLAVASEVFPLIKTGGLADVAGALPSALAAEGVETLTLIPGYPAVMTALRDAEVIHTEPNLFGGTARLLRGRTSDLDLLAIDAPHLYARAGNPYVGPDGRDWPDNAFRFAALSRIAAMAARGELPGISPDVLHAHDWQAGLTAAYLHYGGGRRPGTIVTVHNLAFQGLFPATMLHALGLPDQAMRIDGVEFHGMIGFLKAALALSDRITTVSPTYAAEIQTPESGMGLDGLLRVRSDLLHGILNGIDDAIWNPASDPLIEACFDARRGAARARNTAALRGRFGLDPDPDRLLVGVISRLTWQKGLDLLLDCVPSLVAQNIQLAVLGTGERPLEDGFRDAANRFPGHVGCVIGYDEALAHQMQAGVHALAVPSRFEPCGLTQLCALRYGALPIVARVGGLADTVIDANEAALSMGLGTGVQFSGTMLMPAFQRALALWREPDVWRRLRSNAMRCDVSWRRPAAHYAALYRGLIAERAS